MTIRTLWPLILFFIVSPSFAQSSPPDTPRNPVVDEYHGVKVRDDYRWLEDWSRPEVKKWSEAQNAYARGVLDQLPHLKTLRKEVERVVEDASISYSHLTYRSGQLFGMKHQPPKQQPFLVVMQGLEKERVLLDPVVLDPSGATTIDWFVPSPSARWVAVSLSIGGTESGDVHFYDVRNGNEVFRPIPRVNGGTAGGDVAWDPKEEGVFYTRYPRAKERPPEDLDFYLQLYFHRFGTEAEQDRYELGKQLPRIAEIQLRMHESSGRLLATVQKGDGGEFAHFLRSPAGQWRQFSKFGDRTVQACFGPDDSLYVVSRKDASRGRLLRVPIETLDVAQGKTILPESEDTIVTDFWSEATVLATGNRLYVTYQLGGPSEIRAFHLDGRPAEKPRQLEVASVGGLTSLGDQRLLFSNESFIDPVGWYVFDPASGKTTKTRLSNESKASFGDCRVVREFAVSPDGTRVPMNIIMPKQTKRDGSNPCLATGYGGYGVNILPRFSALRRVLLDHGVVCVVANLRGGSEYGERWHLEGNLTNKQNVFDDFAAVLEKLIQQKYTRPEKLAIQGGSNGGLLMGALATQHPELVKAVVSHVGIYDMLRVELSSNGSFNIPEFGTVKNQDHFAAMFAYSPYHNVKDGVKYPAILFFTGANDPRVDPMQSRKMTARLQAATAGHAPILLRTSDDSGHGAGTPLKERVSQYVDFLAFVFEQLGVKVESN